MEASLHLPSSVHCSAGVGARVLLPDLVKLEGLCSVEEAEAAALSDLGVNHYS